MNQPNRGRPAINASAETAWQRVRPEINLTNLAAHLRISRPAVTSWERVPVKRLDEVVKFTGHSHEILRPDLYPPAEDPWNLPYTQKETTNAPNQSPRMGARVRPIHRRQLKSQL